MTEVRPVSATQGLGPERALETPVVPWLPILMYHRVVDEVDGPDPYGVCISAREFKAQMKDLCDRGYQSISIDDVASAAREGRWPWDKPVVVTFDDGYMDNYVNAFPVLQRFGLGATVMLVSSHIGGANVWDEGTYVEGAPLLGMREIEEMARHGIGFGSHTVTHRAMTLLSREEAWRELVDSKAALEERLGSEVKTFCFPYGLSTPEMGEMAREAGYWAACGVEYGQAEHHLYNLSRINPARCRGSHLLWRLKVSGAYFRAHRNGLLRKLIYQVRRLK